MMSSDRRTGVGKVTREANVEEDDRGEGWIESMSSLRERHRYWLVEYAVR